MIESITLKNVASYDETGIAINSLAPINMIYGANGSGKTTISNFLSNTDDGRFIDCSVNWGDYDPIDCYVYNKRFKEDNLNQTNLKGIFTLGKATKEELDEIAKKEIQRDELTKTLRERRATLSKFSNEKDQLIKDAKKVFWDQIRNEYKNQFKDALKGTGKIDLFYDRIVSESQKKKTTHKNLDDLKTETNALFASVLRELPLLKNYDFFLNLTPLQENDIWKRKIVGKADIDIAKLISELNINDWVNQGRKLLTEESNICPFCQNPTIDEVFRQKIENYFNKEYTESIASLENIKEQYHHYTNSLLKVLNDVLNYEKNNSFSKLNFDEFDQQITIIDSKVIVNKLSIESKLKEPSKIIELKLLDEELKQIISLIDKANYEIKKNNKLFENKSTEAKKLTEETWAYIIQKHKVLIDAELKEINNKERAINGINKFLNGDGKDNRGIIFKRDGLKTEIAELSKKTTSVQPSVDKINTTLESMGFSNFKIAPSDQENHYQIQRGDGTNANETLSEGEISLITFLYYLQWVEGAFDKANIANNRVIVIDDPISSLDSNILFLVSTLIKGLIREAKQDHSKIKQIFLLTHNVYFHKEVSFNAREQSNIKHYILKKIGEYSTVTNYDYNNPIKSSYELLWSEIKNPDNCSDITVQNVLRRIIENYFKILGGLNDEDLIKDFPNKEEQEVCRSLLCWVNDGSHCLPDNLYISSDTHTKELYLKVFKKIFDTQGHIAHYNMMMGIDEIVKEKAELVASI